MQLLGNGAKRSLFSCDSTGLRQQVSIEDGNLIPLLFCYRNSRIGRIMLSGSIATYPDSSAATDWRIAGQLLTSSDPSADHPPDVPGETLTHRPGSGHAVRSAQYKIPREAARQSPSLLYIHEPLMIAMDFCLIRSKTQNMKVELVSRPTYAYPCREAEKPHMGDYLRLQWPIMSVLDAALLGYLQELVAEGSKRIDLKELDIKTPAYTNNYPCSYNSIAYVSWYHLTKSDALGSKSCKMNDRPLVRPQPYDVRGQALKRHCVSESRTATTGLYYITLTD
ncbi:hypothetical protein CCUS01_01768 [Colletotrichum cuscutae]|uniref:Uncharacterized protein n=1 Tax=Colletotrichum cuscutae TaxID=1209917 RepID=A0AAI9XRU4_9PEZI|nr:hypothetical protein CCUS01_01768 [Colletotrichum cuscutae]